jgi:hypothetical protein
MPGIIEEKANDREKNETHVENHQQLPSLPGGKVLESETCENFGRSVNTAAASSSMRHCCSSSV